MLEFVHTQHDVHSMAMFEKSKTTPHVSPRTTTEGQATATPARSRAPACTKPLGFSPPVFVYLINVGTSVLQYSFFYNCRGGARTSEEVYH